VSERQHIDKLVKHVAPVRDEDVLSLTRSEAAEALFDDIVARPELDRPRSPHRRSYLSLRVTWRRGAVAVATACVLAVALLIGATTFTSPAAAGVEIQRQGGYLVATVVDLNADPEAMRAAFRERGLDIDLTLVPVSPSLVGEIVAMSDDRPGIEHLPDKARGCPEELRCGPIGLRIPLGWSGHADVTLGRRARPEEMFVSSGSAFAPGEALHCVTGVIGATVASARAELSRRGIEPIWHADERGYGRILESPDSILDWVVVNAIPASAGSVHLFAEEAPPRESAVTTCPQTR
jgi:hypothetical protein